MSGMLTLSCEVTDTGLLSNQSYEMLPGVCAYITNTFWEVETAAYRKSH